MAIRKAITISLLPLASLGEIIGYRRVNWSRRTGDNILRSPLAAHCIVRLQAPTLPYSFPGPF